MDIRPLTDDYAVSPQIAPSDMATIRAAGYRTVICNRPDSENPAELRVAAMRAAAEEAGLAFEVNAFPSPAMTMDNVSAQRALLDAAEGPVLAYCASGTRSTVVWMFANAGRVPTAELIAATDRAGFSLGGLAPQIDALARGEAG